MKAEGKGHSRGRHSRSRAGQSGWGPKILLVLLAVLALLAILARLAEYPAHGGRHRRPRMAPTGLSTVAAATPAVSKPGCRTGG
jgi:hypothetical protein